MIRCCSPPDKVEKAVSYTHLDVYKRQANMCTAATYKSADFYMGRTLDYEFSYGEEITVMPRRYPLAFRHGGKTDVYKRQAPASFDVVTSNPPYMTGGHGLVNPDVEKAAARHEVLCTLEDVVSAAAKLVRSGEMCIRDSSHTVVLKKYSRRLSIRCGLLYRR